MGKKQLLNQSSWSRAASDTITAQQTIKFAWVGNAVLAVAGGAWVVQIAPQGAATLEIVSRSVLGGLGGLATAVLLLFIWNLVLAPYRQRNEARRLLSEIPSKRKVIADKLAKFYMSGMRLRQAIIKDDFVGDAVVLHGEWAAPVIDYFHSNPDELGESKLLSLVPKDRDMLAPTVILDNKEVEYVYKLLVGQLDNMRGLIEELLK